MGIFEQIKSAFGKTDEEPVIKADTPAPEAEKKPAAEAQPSTPAVKARTYTVQSGDTLWKIADDIYGDGNAYTKIFEANQTVLKSPDHILPGQELVIP
ncbi:MAG: LysM peptidoglycan-binding domain-containing protein [Xanthomonadales bacterium]|jgi:5'-nucleotidase|nr:LysM peptidoglycan-binding domain-containing protein [Xanthomonadales bacterium]